MSATDEVTPIAVDSSLLVGRSENEIAELISKVPSTDRRGRRQAEASRGADVVPDRTQPAGHVGTVLEDVPACLSGEMDLRVDLLPARRLIDGIDRLDV